MTATCDICQQPFNTKDGGCVCSRCGRVYCPRCEKELLVESDRPGAPDPICQPCIAEQNEELRRQIQQQKE